MKPVRVVTAALGFVMLATIAGVLGSAYWRVTTHADVHVALHDVALKTERQLYGSLLAADLLFKDAAGAPLAAAKVDRPLGLVSMIHPSVGDCRAEERVGGETWEACCEAQSRWLSDWLPQVRNARVRFDTCTIENVPVSVERSRDRWWLWWIPTPHIDNSTSTHFNLTMWIDSARCQGAAPVQ